MPPEDDKKIDDKKEDKSSDLAKKIEALEAKTAEYEAKIKELSKGKESGDDPSLADKARKQKDDEEIKKRDTKALEQALTFNLKSEEFLKTNEALLPKEVKEIFAISQKENYANPIEKDQAIKAGILQSFFSVQANVDLLIPSQKTSLDEYFALTKTFKLDKAQHVYETLFEPTLEGLKRVRKAEALSKSHHEPSASGSEYKKKLINIGKKRYLGEKTDA